MTTWFDRLRNWKQDDSNGIGVRSDNHDQEDDNFAVGINDCLNISGLNTPTSNISWGSNKITSVAPGTLATDAANLNQVQTRLVSYALDSVGTDSYAITLSPALTAYAAGQSFYFSPGVSNTGACSLNISGLGAKTIKKDKTVDLNDGDIVANQIVHVGYDGTNFQLLSPPIGLISQNSSAIYAADGGGSDSYAITLAPALVSYATGLVVYFKANTGNTGVASLNINALGAKTIKKNQNIDLNDNDIVANQIVQLIYDGTNFQILSPTYATLSQNSSAIYAADAGASDTYVITLSPAPIAYTTGMVIRFKANTLNTGASSLNANSLGGIALKKFGTTNDTATGDILAGQIVEVVYDGTNFQILSAIDDINNLSTGTVSKTSDFVKIWNAATTSYKKATIANINIPSTGTPIQTVFTSLISASTVAVTAGTFSDISGLSVAITPTSASSTVLISGFVTLGSSGGAATNCFINLVRGSTPIGAGTTPGSRVSTIAASSINGTASTISIPFSFVDTPATTSPTTYKIQATTNLSSTLGINRSSDDTNSTNTTRSSSVITAQELSA